MKKYITILFYSLFIVNCGIDLPEEVDTAYQNLPEKIDFNYHVKPILSDKCYACHGPDKQNQKAGLRLDTPEGAYRILKGNPGFAAVFPGKPSKSEAVRRILSREEDLMMPPPESHLTLSSREIATIIKWIEQEAEYKLHWSFIKPEKPDLPKLKQGGWAQNPIDFFVLYNLEKAGLKPSEKATKETLIRRLSFDITGLPPTQDQIEAFVRNDSPEAYENLVDRLLNSSAYGEQMAMAWMDVARYADSDGYLDDKHRDFSPWRDWVINAFNKNMPYDQFTTWQLAGDLIPDASKESILATAFNRLHRKNSEAGIVFDEFRTEYVADRTHTLGKAFMGLTMECARCHDHKYDPISQEDYYKMFGFFNSTNELGTAVYGPGQTPGPTLLLSDNEQQKITEYIDKIIANLEEKAIKLQDPSREDYQNWSNNRARIIRSLAVGQHKNLIAYYPMDSYLPLKKEGYVTPDISEHKKTAKVKDPIIKQGIKNQALFLNDFTKITLPEKTGWFERTQPFSISVSIYPDTVYEEAGIFYHCENLRLGLKGYSLFLEDNRLKFIMANSWPHNTIQLRTRAPIPEKEWTRITITYDGSSSASGIKIYINGEKAPLNIDYDHLYKSILYKPDIHTYGFNGFMFGQRGKMKMFKNGGIDELKIYSRALSELEVLYSAYPEKAIQYIDKSDEVKNQSMLVEHYFQNHDSEYAKLEKDLLRKRVRLNMHLDSIPEIMVMGDLKEPRPTYLLERGTYNAPTKQVTPGTPEAVFPFDENLPKNRLGLSKWLFDKDHPLTARVFVNRIWQMYFGRGIVKTSDDFGNQGALPSHPDLIDWLAVEFMESGWNIKKLHKWIVMSATYQQSSKMTKKLLEVDPENILLARGSSFRLSAEMIRDNALFISGLMVDKIGGASVYPYQPEGLWDEISNKPWRYKYMQKSGEGLYRRSLYTIWKRTAPPPSMLIFDAPDRGVCTVNRRITSTPLQALVLLNDPQFIEAARVTAENIITENNYDLTYQLKRAFRLVIGRTPSKDEMGILNDFYESEIDRFLADEAAAFAYLSIGETERNKALNPARIAALATVISSIMNSYEAYTRK